MPSLFKIPLVLTPQPEGGFTVTSPALPELVSEGDTLEEAAANAQDALKAVLELYEDMGLPFPSSLKQDAATLTLEYEALVAMP